MFTFVHFKNNYLMKRIIVLLAVTVFLLNGTIGQTTLKLGHIDSRVLFAAMPESDSAQKTLEASLKEMQTTLEQLQVEFNKKYEDYLALTKNTTISELIVRTKEEELQTLQQRIQTFQQQAEQDMGNQRTELFKPIQDKAVKAVSDVAEENGFTYIFDTAGGALVYMAPDSQDILALVKKKLGIK
jgi:outer membrane protein